MNKIKKNLLNIMKDTSTKTIILSVLLFIPAMIVGGIWSGCVMALTMSGPLIFFCSFGIQISLIILVIVYYLYPEEVWEMLNEVKKYSRRGLHKLQEAINVHHNA